MPGVVVISIPVTDQDRAAKFYTDYFGFHLIGNEAMGPNMRWVHLAHGDEAATITLTTWFDKLTPGVLQGLMLYTEDPDALRERMVADGIECSDCDDQPWGRFFSTSDPDGNGLIAARTTS